jgi:hypothetical protein
MSAQQPPPYPPQMPGGPAAYAPPQVPLISAGYRRWAKILLGLAIAIAVLMVVALVASFVLLAVADADVDNAAYGYLAIFVWFGLFGALPFLLGFGIPGVVMTRRVRQQRTT